MIDSSAPRPVSVAEMTSPEGRRIRAEVFSEVRAMVNLIRCSSLAFEDELDGLLVLVEMEIDRGER